MARVLVVAAHPDDEVLGCGGALAKHVQAGDSVAVLILAEGVTSRSIDPAGNDQAASLASLLREAQAANALLGVTSLWLRGFPDNRMDTTPLLDVVKEVEAAIAASQPSRVYTHHAGDVNVDHRRIHEAVVVACRSVPGQCVRELLFFEVASSTEWQPPGSAPTFAPSVFINVGDTMSVKLQALSCYASELREFPHPRSTRAVEALACWRGATAGFAAAEAFMLGRWLIN